MKRIDSEPRFLQTGPNDFIGDGYAFVIDEPGTYRFSMEGNVPVLTQEDKPVEEQPTPELPHEPDQQNEIEEHEHRDQ